MRVSALSSKRKRLRLLLSLFFAWRFCDRGQGPLLLVRICSAYLATPVDDGVLLLQQSASRIRLKRKKTCSKSILINIKITIKNNMLYLSVMGLSGCLVGFLFFGTMAALKIVEVS